MQVYGGTLPLKEDAAQRLYERKTEFSLPRGYPMQTAV